MGKFRILIFPFLFCIFHECKSRHAVKNKPRSSSVCFTSECKNAAFIIRQFMNPKVAPCDDFYQFACGNYTKNAVIPKDETYVNRDSFIQEKVQNQLKISIEEKINENEPRSITLAKNFYKACMDTDAIEKNGLKTVLGEFKKIGGWPVLENSWNETKFDWKQTTYVMSKLGYAADYLFTFKVSVDSLNSTKRVLNIDQPTLAINREYLIKGFNNNIVKAYYNYTVEIAVLFGANRARAEKELKESLEFEIKLANISLSEADRSNATSLYNPMTVKELLKKYPSIPWKKYFNSVLQSIVINENEVIIVSVPDFLKKFEILMKETRSKRVLANYFLCRAAQEDADLLTNAIRNSKMKFTTVLNGQAERQVRWKECLDMTSGILGISIGALYARKYITPESKKIAEELTVDIEKKFKQMLEKINWMDEPTRRGALDKIASTKNFIGYPDELFDNKKLDEFFQKVEVNSNDYLEAATNLSIFWTQHFFNQLRQPVNKSDWTTHSGTFIVNAYNHIEENSIEIPAGILQDIYFDKNKPQYMNYAVIGLTIGHEVSHSFDNHGSQYDKNGNLKDWWTPVTKKKFLEKADCIVKQYGNYTAEEVGLKVNGVNTQGENIADNVGVKISYLAYQDWAKRNGPESKLPGLNYSQSQLFWISGASMWCKKHRPEFLKDYITTNAHSPSEFRVLGPYSNSPEFAKDFNCPLGSKMNPVKKCSVW